MSLEVQVNVDLSQVEGLMQSINDGMTSIGEGLKESVDNIIMPDLYAESTTVWTPRTYQYANGWVSEQIGLATVNIANEMEYADPLEFGWTRGSTRVDSPGVLIPVVLRDIADVGSALLEWLKSKVQ